MRAKRAEFSKLTKAQAAQRANGRCECGCGLKIQGIPHYDHIIPAAIGGEATLENCAVLDPKCHRLKTLSKDVPEITRTKRLEENRLGLRTKRGRPMPGSRASGLKKKMDGTVERRK